MDSIQKINMLSINREDSKFGGTLMRTTGDQEEVCILEAIRTANMHRDEVAESLVDNSVLIIAAATARRALTVREISTVTNIPLATCYKIVEKMSTLGLLAETGKVRTSTRGKASMYTASMRSFSVDLTNGSIDMHVTWKNGQIMNINREVCMTVPQGEVPAGADASLGMMAK